MTLSDVVISTTARVYSREGYLVQSGVEIAYYTETCGPERSNMYLRVGSCLLWWHDLIVEGNEITCQSSGMKITW